MMISRLAIRTAIKQRPMVRHEASLSALANRNFKPQKKSVPMRPNTSPEERVPVHKPLHKEEAMELSMLYKEIQKLHPSHK